MREDVLITAAVLLGAYVTGAIPFAYLIGRAFWRTDIRDHGSGNVGATNVFRVFGAWPAVLVALLDGAKGYVSIWVSGAVSPAGWDDWLMIAAGMAAVLGHSFTPFLGFSGGKGVATAAGVLARLTPLSVATLTPVFVAVVGLSRTVSLGSLVVAAAYPVTVLVFYSDRLALVGFSVLASALVIWRHRSNILRIARRTEPRISAGRWRDESPLVERVEEPR